MSGEKEKISCSVCRAYLFDEDDVVYCPECGAPHHRDCYMNIGHCALEEFHGTENQYDKVREKEREEAEKTKEAEPIKEEAPPKFRDAVVCPNCQNTYPSIMQRCPRCGAVNPQSGAPRGGMPFPMFDLLGGIPKDMDLGEGVTADEAKQFVISNTPRYIPKFAAMKVGTKISWNWLAFLLPSAWYMSRKMYAKGILSIILLVACALLTLPLASSIVLPESSAMMGMESQTAIMQSVLSAGKPQLILAIIGFVLEIGFKIFIGMFADLHYRNHVIDTVSAIKKNSESITEDMRKKGGLSFWGLFIGFFAVQYLPTVIAYFFNLM